MYKFPIGIILESLKMPRRDAIKKAAEIGAKGIQMYATEGENSPRNLSSEARAELKDEVASSGLVFFRSMRRPRHGLRKSRKKPGAY